MADRSQSQRERTRAEAQQTRDPDTVEKKPLEEAQEAERQADNTPAVVAGAEPAQGQPAAPETQEQAEKDQQAREGQRADTASDSAKEGEHVTGEAPRKTTLDTDVSMPGYVAPGDGPHDTVVAIEHASSVTPDKATAGQAGFGVVNAVVPIPDPSGRAQAVARAAEAAQESAGRVEEYEVPGPTGLPVKVRRNVETGASEVLD